MAGYLVAGLDTALIGTFSVPITDADGSRTVTISEDTYAHVDLSSVMGAGEYADLATEFETQLNSGATGNPWSVSWAAATGYTITYSGTASIQFSSAATDHLAHALGFNTGVDYGFTAGFPTQTSALTPYYFLDLARDGVSDYEPAYKIAGQVKRASSNKGNGYAVRPTTQEKGVEFRYAFQSQASVFSAQATSSDPWTYEDLMDHAWAAHPILLHTSTLDIVYKNVEPLDFTKDSRRVVWSNYHGKWHLDVRGQYLGSL